MGIDVSIAVQPREENRDDLSPQAARDFHSDLIVMGTHGRTGIAHLPIGSVAEKVVRASPLPVATVRESA